MNFIGFKYQLGYAFIRLVATGSPPSENGAFSPVLLQLCSGAELPQTALLRALDSSFFYFADPSR